MAVLALERQPQRRAPELDEAELGRLAGVLSRYRAYVARAVAGDVLASSEYVLAEHLLEQVWLPASCWARDVSAWRESAVIGERLEVGAVSEARAVALRHRQAELELLHPHLFSSLPVAAAFRWESGAR